MKLAFYPLDTWFFRDGTPFDKKASPQEGVVGVFPPYPPTIAGALRVALAHANGWDGHSPWSRELEAILGDGPESLGQLRITGPLIVRRSGPVFRMPRHVRGRVEADGRWRAHDLVRLSGAPTPTDLGHATRLPAELDDGKGRLSPGEGRMTTLRGLARILRGELPSDDDVIVDDDLWTSEPRVGIERELTTRTAVDGALYSTQHVRARPEVGVGVWADGLPSNWSSPAGSLIPLGGESRLAACDRWDPAAPLWRDVPIDDSGTFLLVALTPVLLERDVFLGKSELGFEGARVVFACTDRPMRIGGWDSRRREPLPMKNALPAGTTLFCETDRPDVLREAMSDGLLRIGRLTTMGFGLCAVGSGRSWERAR
ncbi:MAG: type III-B CRISPR module-associated protein Cmr3 [Labilithrix sp.]|nr:type III-B CRISPR module-associated protein Cmr3 [Labilithrix sp.]MBX3216451.1 type III-B CRISPR module-associated protein Cmr3 [Labilithrix sp.]